MAILVSSVDVAKLAGVSQATVSRVMNNPEKVNAETFTKVNAAIQELNYRPNAAARSLISRKSGIVALLCGPLEDPDNAEFSARSIAYAQEKGFITEIHIQDPTQPGTVFEAISRSQAEGILVGPITPVGTGIASLKNSGIPFVFCGADQHGEHRFVSLDNAASGKLAADYLNNLSHTVVGWVGGGRNESHHGTRYRGFLETAKSQGMKICSAAGAYSDFDGVLSAMMARKDRPTAIAAATDALAAQAIDFLIAYGYSIPEDMSVLGIGNSPQSAMNYLSLTTIGLPPDRDIFKEAVTELLALIHGDFPNHSFNERIEPELFIRNSSAPNQK
ncbi:LacI family DNA-binding transcriptional regulator [Planococcus salinarum]|uniref:LacI family DNA-binding transcriptional regulator n=1 Tax=Planococcus salinarum TaxID=622695 RepID=UPI000E3BB4B5|nr:LacI family DNA-binding transcriptional regulator [Planococcus salinarum]TAA72708.1 LacI family transcriptional regulator [Planococcus salinarum]